MLEKSKTAFYNLLTKIDAIDISESSYRNDALETQFSNIEDEYKKLRRAILTKLEDIKCTSDILNQGFGTNHIEILNNPLKKASDKIITEINSIEMQEKIIPFNLIKGEWLFCQGRIKEGQDCWEKVLKVDLYNNYIYSKLIEIRHSTSGLKGLIEDLKKKYRFEYMGSFGHNISKGTSDITVSEYDGSIYACNLKANKIIKFNANGDYICSISADLKKPYGIFTDEDNIWICDMNNSRLVLVDSKGCLLKKIIIKDIVGCKFSQTKPILGTLHKNRIYLILKNDNTPKRLLIYFDKHNPYDYFGVLPLDKVLNPNGIQIYEEKLYTGCNRIGGLYSYDFKSNQLRIFNEESIPYIFRRFVKTGKGFIISAGFNIMKISDAGQVIFTINFGRAINRYNATPAPLAVARENNSEILFVMDKTYACIRKFLI